MIATYEIKREYETSELNDLATYVGREGLFLTGFRYQKNKNRYTKTEGSTSLQLFGVESIHEAETLRKKIGEKLGGVMVEMYIQPELDVEF